MLGERTCIIDCDVIQADGGTRTLSVTGAYVALALALKRQVRAGLLTEAVFKSHVAAISAGIVDGQVCLDLCYHEDVRAEVDANIVMNEEGGILEIQGTAEKQAFSREQYDQIVDLSEKGIKQLISLQKSAIQSCLEADN